jgi:hypothetical protein
MEAPMTTPRQIGVQVLGFVLTALLLIAAWPAGVAAQVSFKEEVFPIIELRCLECHQPGGIGYETSGLDLRTYESLMRGTKYGSMITPGSWIESNLLAVIDHRTARETWMPHNKRALSKCEQLSFRYWVMQGAKNN